MQITIRELGSYYKLIHIIADYLNKVTHYVLPLQTAIDMDLCINCIQEELIADETSLKDDVSYELDQSKLKHYILSGVMLEFEFQEKQIRNLYEIQRQNQR